MKRYYIFFFLLALVSVGAIAAQAMMSGPIKADRTLSTRVQILNERVQTYYQTNRRLPGELAEVEGDHEGITYSHSGNNYELCGTFQTSTQGRDDSALRLQTLSPGVYIDASRHPRGYYCFKAIAEEINKPEPKVQTAPVR